MSKEEQDIYVQAETGSYHKNPTFCFPEGFVIFLADDTEKTLFVYQPCEITAEQVLDLNLGEGRWADCKLYKEKVRVAVPDGSTPPRFHSADVYRFTMKGAPVTPTFDEGSERYVGRIKNATIIRWVNMIGQEVHEKV